MPINEHKVRARAYQLWMQDGCKEGRSDQYWFQAERELYPKGGEAADPSQACPQPSLHAPRAPRRSAAGARSKAGQKSPMRSLLIQAQQPAQR